MKTPDDKSRRKVSRRLPTDEEYQRGLQLHTKLVGEVVWAWNELNLAYARAFAWEVNEKRFWIGQHIWTALNNDSAQRDILAAILPWSQNRAMAKRLEWALKETGKLARYRNDVVHGPMKWTWYAHGPIPTLDYFANPFGRLIRYIDWENEEGYVVEGVKVQELMVLLRGDLMQLANYVNELWRITPEKPSPLPQRPRLRAHKFAQSKAWKPPPPKRRPKRRIRPKSSRA